MKTLCVTPDGRGAPRLESLALPFFATGPTATSRDRDLAPEASSATAIRHVRAIEAGSGLFEVFEGDSERRLYIVVAGSLQVVVPEMRASLGPGDVLFLDVTDPLTAPATLSSAASCAFLEVEVEAGWQPIGTVPPALDEERRSPRAAPLALRMVSDGALTHLMTFDDLFSPLRAHSQEVASLSFVCLSPAMDSDWHTEPNASLLVVLSGGFQLEASGDGGRRTLRAGDVCLVEDFDGQGHKSSSDGETRFVVLRLPRDHRWSSPRRTNELTDGAGA